MIGLVFGLFSLFFNPFLSWKSCILGMMLGFSTLLVATILTNGGFGGGDIKFAGVIGLFLGFKYMFLVLVVSAWINTSYLIIAKKNHGPFGPALSLSSLFFTISIIYPAFSF